MRKSVSSQYTTAALDAGKLLGWKFYIKKTASLSESLSTGTWIDVTERIKKERFGISERIEYNLWQFSGSSITLIGKEISYWKNNIFNFANFLEVKIEFTLNSLTADTIVVFAGWVDKPKDTFMVHYDEAADTVRFTVFSYQEFANRRSAADVVFQPVNPDVDGAGLDGLILQNIPGVYVTNAFVASFVLKKGVHVITYDFNGGTERAKLDNGAFFTLRITDGIDTLVNEDSTQKIEVFVKVSQLSTSVNVTQDIIVTTQGNTIPNVWYQRVWVFQLLRKLYEKIGITDYTFDNFQIQTFDSRNITSFFEIPLGDTFYQRPTAIAFDEINTNTLWVGVEDRVYKRDFITNTYTLVGTPQAGYDVVRFFVERALQGQIIGLTRNSSGAYRLFRITVSTSTIETFTITAASTNTAFVHNFAFADKFLPGGGGGVGAVFWINPANNAQVKYFDFNDGLEHTSGNILSNGTFTAAAWSDGIDYFCLNDVGTDLVKILIDEAQNFVKTDLYLNGTLMAYGAYDRTAGVFIGGGSGGTGIYKVSGSTQTTLDAAMVGKNFIFSDVDDKIHFLRYDAGQLKAATVQTVGATSTITTLAGEITKPFSQDFIDPDRSAFLYEGFTQRRIGFFDYSYVLFQFYTKSSMYIDIEADFETLTIGDAVKQLAIAFNTMPRVSSVKKAYVYRRGDDTGTIITTGNTVTLNADKAVNLSERTGYGQAYDIVTVANSSGKESRDAAGFGAVAFANERELKVTNTFFPTALLKDFAYYFYQFFKTTRTLYLVPTPLVPLFQFEPFDAGNLVFSGKISVNKTGVILSQRMSSDGSTEFEVLVT